MFLIYARELLGWLSVGGEEIEIFIYFPSQIEFSLATYAPPPPPTSMPFPLSGSLQISSSQLNHCQRELDGRIRRLHWMDCVV